MTKLATLQRRVSSIFRKRKIAPKTKEEFSDIIEVEEDDTVKLEESESEITLNASCTFDYAPPKEQVDVESAIKPKKDGRSVSFSHVTVRHYDLILGDNPCCKYPLSLGWNFHQEETRDVDSFEEHRAEREAQASNDRIQPRLYVPPSGGPAAADHYLSDVHTEQDFDDEDSKLLSELSLYERRARLRAFGYTEAALRQAERQRIVALALEWKDGGNPRFPFSTKFITRYAR